VLLKKHFNLYGGNMTISRILLAVCLCVLLVSPVSAQNAPGGAAPQGAPPGGAAPQGGGAPQGGAPAAAMPQTKSFNANAFVDGVDTNKDGFMTKEEFKAAGLTDRMFLTPPFCDPDHDGKISRKEMNECKLPETVDMNKDGKITKEEMVSFEGTSQGKERGPGEPKPE
jgi:hypothetical protein